MMKFKDWISPNIGYKIVAFDGEKAYSLYGGKEYPISIETGSVITDLKGFFLATNIAFAKDYYSGLTDDQDMILTYEYHPDDVIFGDPTSDGEIKVKKAKLIGKKIL